jgi:signal transduction histidine kinase/DNA-binding response OmpR family regulator
VDRQYTIGFSQCTLADNWRKMMLQGMERELSFHPEIGFIVKDANASTEKQMEQIQELIDEDIDLLIVSPNEAAPITPIVEKAFKKGIEVIIVDRRTTSPHYTAYVGASNYEVGVNAGTYANSFLKGVGNVVEIGERPGSSADIDRHNGFMDVIKKYPEIKYIKKFEGDWDKNPVNEKLSDFLASPSGNIQLIFAQNDRFALQAYEACKKMGLEKKVNIIGVDGLPGKNGGIELVDKGLIKATIFYPTGGEEAIIAAENILAGKPYKKENLLMTSIIDSTNVRIMKLQTEKLLAQQKDIDRRQRRIVQQEMITRNKITIIYIVSISLALAIILGAILFYYLKENKKINAKLALQNEEILNQRNRLIELAQEAKEATEAKFKFFTNISHEFRTPLTLILGPLEELLANTKSQKTQQSLTLIQKNVIRLLRLVNQLMDFRKIEGEKMKLRASENDLIAFVSEITHSYKSIAQKRNIDLRLITKERQLNTWFDVSMIDKVIFNLLSNAFKFTKDNGFVHIYISKSEDGQNALVKVEDNGVGMSKEAIEHAFEVFYQGEYENYKGSGLGLALSKELIQLHKGLISVRSEKWKGTTFEIQLPLGNKHLAKEEISEAEADPAVLYEHEKIYTSDLEPEKPVKNEDNGIQSEKELSVLIIEDNPDLRHFLKSRLKAQFEILEADNGQAALQQAFDTIPDLIICDVVIPGKDGMALTNIFKTDIRTSHIPVILLTAKTAIEQQIEGMKNRADAYITKPFNVQFLEQTIKSLLANRALLKEHFTGELSTGLKTQTVNKLDKKFINEFTSLVESNLSNEDFNVEEICKSLGVSRVQLYRKIKALMNINVNDYILNTRLQKAKYLLQHEESTISEIAYKVGFSSPAYFSTVFKSKFGMTPKVFKEK